jgi:hypothetical protein
MYIECQQFLIDISAIQAPTCIANRNTDDSVLAHNIRMLQQPVTAACQVLERHKVRLPNEVSHQIPQLKGANKSVAAWAVPGEFGGIQIVFSELPNSGLRARIEHLIRRGDTKASEAKENWTLIARSLSNAWGMTFSLYGKTFTAVLPDVARALRLVPEKLGDHVIIFICGDIFEIWHPDQWLAVNKDTKSRMDLIETDLQEVEAKNPH